MPIGAQMFTLREHCKTVDDAAKSLERVKAMGYDGIQASAAIFNSVDPADVKALKRALDDNGLVCGATHEGLLKIESDDDVKAIVEKHQILDCKLTAIGGFNPGADDWTRQNWLDFIKKYNDLAARFAESGLRIGYHNHSHELAPLDDGSTPAQMLVDGLDESIWFEWDVYWLAHGLADPVEWVNKVAGRIPAVHYKDGTPNAKREHVMWSIGTGNLNWPKINDACKAAGVEWYLVERDSGPEDPFDSLEKSAKTLRGWGL